MSRVPVFRLRGVGGVRRSWVIRIRPLHVLSAAVTVLSFIFACVPVTALTRSTSAPTLSQVVRRAASAIKDPVLRNGAFPASEANRVLLAMPAGIVEKISAREFYYGVSDADRKLSYEVHLTCLAVRRCGRFELAINVVPPTRITLGEVTGLFGRRFVSMPVSLDIAHDPHALSDQSGQRSFETLERGREAGLAHIRLEIGQGDFVDNIAIVRK